ncbi:MAG: (d)CMP kinase [Gemmataceae bacterium]|nr:(d)CMP kinase [Gemmataceae bacterium]
MPMIVTIDGPAGAGKSTAARRLAARLGFAFLDTGAMYRAVALAARRAAVAWTDDRALAPLVEALPLEMEPGGVVRLAGEDVSSLIRTPEVSQGASVVADSPAVRPRLTDMQRRLAQGRSIVCEGRDQGTVVFPDAGCKFFLVADPEERLQRRLAEMRAKGHHPDEATIRREMAERDARDSGRELAPLRPAEDAVRVDSTAMSADEVVAFMEAEVRRRLEGSA